MCMPRQVLEVAGSLVLLELGVLTGGDVAFVTSVRAGRGRGLCGGGRTPIRGPKSTPRSHKHPRLGRCPRPPVDG
jgi:hypothetical protein